MWARSFGPNVTAGGVATDGAGDLLFTGDFETPVDFGCGTLEGMSYQFFQPFVVALDEGGACRYSRWLHVDGAAEAYGIVADAAADVVVTGTWNGDLDLGGAPIPATGNMDVFVAALHPDGSLRWGKGFGNAGGGSVTMNGAGDVFFGGGFSRGRPTSAVARSALSRTSSSRLWAPTGATGGPGRSGARPPTSSARSRSTHRATCSSRGDRRDDRLRVRTADDPEHPRRGGLHRRARAVGVRGEDVAARTQGSRSPLAFATLAAWHP